MWSMAIVIGTMRTTDRVGAARPRQRPAAWHAGDAEHGADTDVTR
jgi:hypothetical protein